MAVGHLGERDCRRDLDWGLAAAVLVCRQFRHLQATYGSLGAVISFMVWMWLSTIVVLLGAEFNAEMEHQTAKDTTKGRPKPMGGRGAKMADKLGEARA